MSCSVAFVVLELQGPVNVLCIRRSASTPAGGMNRPVPLRSGQVPIELIVIFEVIDHPLDVVGDHIADAARDGPPGGTD